MKYQCDVCGVSFENEAQCKKHEQECIEHYQGLIYITDELNVLINSAKIQKLNLGVEIPVLAEDKTISVYYELRKAHFKVDKNRITVETEPNETNLIIKPNEDQNAKKTKR